MDCQWFNLVVNSLIDDNNELVSLCMLEHGHSLIYRDKASKNSSGLLKNEYISILIQQSFCVCLSVPFSHRNCKLYVANFFPGITGSTWADFWNRAPHKIQLGRFTKANSLQTNWFSKLAHFGHICSYAIRETALYSLETSLQSNYSKQTAKKIKNIWPDNHE